MKRVLCITLLSTAAFLPQPAHAQVLCALGPAEPPYDPTADMPPSAEAQAELKRVKSLLCPKACGKVFLLANATAPNSATVTDGDGASKIVYRPSFVKSAQKSFGPIAPFGILAHELGHHLEATGQRPAWMKERWDGELGADAWAGCAMAKAALTPSRLQAVLLVLSTYPSARHPAWSARRAAITDGYQQCGGRILPALGRDADEPASGATGATAGTTTVAAAPHGCTNDKDCRNGRRCLNGRCGVSAEPRRCGKDTDCPEPQECNLDGRCDGPAAAASRPEEPPAKPARPVLAKVEEPQLKVEEPRSKMEPQRQAASPPAKEAACQRTCDEVRNLCIEAATSEGNRCLAAIQAEPSYRACSCPSYPAGNADCYRICAGAYERGKICSSTTLVVACRTDGDRCRQQCP